MSGYSYRPHTSKTRGPYEQLLVCLRRAATTGALEGELEAVATDVIGLGRRPGVDISDRKHALDRLFGSAAEFSDESARDVFALCAELDDFILDESERAIGGVRARRGGGADDDDNDDDDDDDKSIELAEGDADDAAFRAFEYGDDGADEDDDGAGGSGGVERPPTLNDVDGAYLEGNLRRLLPSLPHSEVAARAEAVLGFLAAEDEPDGVVATQLMMALDAFSDPAVEAWLNAVVAGRWAVVYGLRKAAGQYSSHEELVAAAREHAGRDAAVGHQVLAALTGSAGNTAAADADVDAGASGSGSRRAADMQVVDLESYKFEQGSRLMAKKGKTVVPTGTTSNTFKTHQEIIIPAQETDTGHVTLVGLEEFAAWARPTFPSYVKALNPMQSTVFPSAYHTDDNLLICAPTGAGKTNVAMTAILRELAKWRDAEKDAFHYDLVKLVYIAPMKALVQEVVRTFGERLAPLGIRVAELSGDQSLSKAQLDETQLIVTTPEKWDIVTRKGMDRGAAATVRLVIIDEVHLLHSDRGPVLESIVARTRRAVAAGIVPPVRLVGLSATLPNYEDVGAFLGVEKGRGLFRFGAEFRPVGLQQTFVGIENKAGRATKSISVVNDVCASYALDFAKRSQPVLVFVHGRKETVSTADFIRKAAAKADPQLEKALSRHGTAMADRLKDAADRARHRSLQELLPCGVGFHNAGLCREDRAIVEELFLNRDLLVLVSTSTLAWGVNLPARGVIIKGTKVYSPQAGGYEDLSPLDVFQMFGRAGRPGFGTNEIGEAIIITSRDDLEYYLSLLTQQLPIESHLVTRLVDALNAEVVLGTVKTVDDAVKWLEHTYLHVRMMRAPKLYGVAIADARRDPTLRDHRENLAHTALKMIATRELGVYDLRAGDVRSTELGRIASHYYLTEASMATYAKHLKGDVDDIDIFRIFSLSSEFARISTRTDELPEVRRLAEECPIPIRDPIESGSGANAAAAKINVLLQAYISGLSLEGFNLMSELVYVKDSALRIAKALHDIALCRGLAATARRVLVFYNQVLRKQWAVMSPLRQFGRDHVPLGLIQRMEARPIDWEAYYHFDVERGQYADFAPNDLDAQELLFAYVHRVPRFDIDYEHVVLQPLTRSKVRCEILVVPDFEYDADLHGPGGVELLLTIEDGDGQKLLHRESVFVKPDDLRDQKPIAFVALLRVADPKPTHFFVRAAAVGWIGSETSASLDLMSVPLPAPAAPPRVPPSLPSATAGDLEQLNDEWLDAFFLEELVAFRPAQLQLLDALYRGGGGGSAFVGMPHGSGRGVVSELFMLRQLKTILDPVDGGDAAGGAASAAAAIRTIVYLHPDDAVCARRAATWAKKLAALAEFVPVAGGGAVALVRLLDPSVCGGVDENVAAIRRATGGATKARIVIATPTAWREIAWRAKENAALLGSVAAVVADGFQWAVSEVGTGPGGIAVSQPPFPGFAAGNAGVGYEALVARIVQDSRERAKAASSSTAAAAAPELHLLVASTPLLHAQQVASWARVPDARVYNFSAALKPTKVIVEPANSASRAAEAGNAIDRVVGILESPKYLVARVAVVISNPKRVADTASLIAKLLRDTALKPFPGVEDARLARILSSGVAFVDEALSASDVAAVCARLMQPDATPPGLTLPTVDGRPQELTVVATPGMMSHFAPGAFDYVLIASPSAEASHSPDGSFVASTPTAEFQPALLNAIASRAADTATILCGNDRAPYWLAVASDMAPALPGTDQRLMPYLAHDLARGLAADANDDAADNADAAGAATAQIALVRAMAAQLLPDVNQWIAEGKVRSMNHLMKALGTLYMAKAVRACPGSYFINASASVVGGDDAEERMSFFSQIAETAVTRLQSLHCVNYKEEDLTVAPTPFGLTAARHAMHPSALGPLLRMRERAGLADLVAAFARAPSVHAACPYIPSDERAVDQLVRMTPAASRFTNLRVDPCRDATSKAVGLLAAFAGRARPVTTCLPIEPPSSGSGDEGSVEKKDAAAAASAAGDVLSEHVTERTPPHMRAVCAQARTVAAMAFRMAVAAVDLYARLSWPLARAAMRLAGLITQASTDTTSALLQMPFFGPRRVAVAAAAAPSLTAPEQLAELDDAEREAVLAGLPAAAVGDIAGWCNAVPAVDVECTAAMSADGAAALVTLRLNILLAEEDDAEDEDQEEEAGAAPKSAGAQEIPPAQLPYWIRPTRPGRWWVAVTGGEGESETLRALRFVLPSSPHETLAMRVGLTEADKAKVTAAGAASGVGPALGLRVALVSDTFRMELLATVA